MDGASRPRPTISAGLYYRDASAAIDWLERAFGFRRHLIIPGPGNTVVHSELEFEGDFIMVGTADAARGTRSPLDGIGYSQGLYVVVDDPDAHYARAVANGAQITRELGDTGFGSRTYGARDPEGHEWTFGTYRLGAADSSG